MKMLVIGMDGVDASDFQRGYTPFIASLLDQGSHVPLKEDLITRGWSEIILGASARVTGAFYDRPVAEGRYEWTDKFRIVDVPGIGKDVKPIWEVLNEQGYRTGIMNIPTTFPASVVDGFFVSGGGGGGPVTQDVVTEQCYPFEIKDELHKLNYILDERIGSLLFEKRLTKPDQFFGRLEEMTVNRTDAFIHLAECYPIDFGMIVFKSETMVTETLGKPVISSESSEKEKAEMATAIENFYRVLDKSVQRLVEFFPDSEVLLVSDHGTTLRRYSVNLNAFLRRQGYQDSQGKGRSLYKLLSKTRHWIPKSIRAKLKKTKTVARKYSEVTPFNLKNAVAFNNTRRNEIHGIFINDEARFGGGVSSEEVQFTAEKIVEKIHNAPEAIEHGIKAYCNDFTVGGFSTLYPDVIVDLPDGYLPSNDSEKFVDKYCIKDYPSDLSAIRGDEKHCIKSHSPLCVVSNISIDSAAYLESENLCWVYKYIQSRFSV